MHEDAEQREMRHQNDDTFQVGSTEVYFREESVSEPNRFKLLR
jgi:hypothetical protein